MLGQGINLMWENQNCSYIQRGEDRSCLERRYGELSRSKWLDRAVGDTGLCVCKNSTKIMLNVCVLQFGHIFL